MFLRNAFFSLLFMTSAVACGTEAEPPVSNLNSSETDSTNSDTNNDTDGANTDASSGNEMESPDSSGNTPTDPAENTDNPPENNPNSKIDFQLLDRNESSLLHNQEVSTQDQRGKISAWYFTHAN